MNRRRSKPRFAIILSLMMLLAPALLPLSAEESGLRPYSATYDLYYSGMHVATTRIALQRHDRQWSWSTLTRARGIYRMFTSKKPYSETRFSHDGGVMQLHEIRLSNHGNERHHETARFDWDDGRMKVLRKGKSWEVDLVDGIYDYQSIHLLADEMRRTQKKSATVSFYRKGKLVDSRIVHKGRRAR